MVFTSFNFLIFFPLLTILYWLTPSKYKWLTLLVASYYFYISMMPVFAFLVAGVTLSTYIFTRLMDKTEIDSKKKTLMRLNIVCILLPLFFFKYFGSINNGAIELFDALHIRWPLPAITLMLPVGISFYTFMAIGYTIDVYNEEIESEKHIGILALFISFFPLVLSGPIERAKNMLPQFQTPKSLDYATVSKGLKMMLWGYFLKLVVADRIGLYVDTIYGNIPLHEGKSMLFAACLYPFQVYADLGGYSLVAIGTACILGISVKHNFNRPFFATSMSEFWRRWHISLISWLTDYVYTPLSFAFRKYKVTGIVMALMVTFLISGVWHGASLTFVVWGIMQGIFLSIEALTNKKRAAFEKKNLLNNKWWYVLAGITVTFVLFAASQIFGRATSMEQSLAIYAKIFSFGGQLFMAPSIMVYAMIGLSMLLFKDITDEYTPGRFLLFESKHKAIRVLSYSSVIIIILLLGVFDGGQFIYFKF